MKPINPIVYFAIVAALYAVAATLLIFSLLHVAPVWMRVPETFREMLALSVCLGFANGPIMAWAWVMRRTTSRNNRTKW